MDTKGEAVGNLTELTWGTKVIGRRRPWNAWDFVVGAGFGGVAMTLLQLGTRELLGLDQGVNYSEPNYARAWVAVTLGVAGLLGVIRCLMIIVGLRGSALMGTAALLVLAAGLVAFIVLSDTDDVGVLGVAWFLAAYSLFVGVVRIYFLVVSRLGRKTGRPVSANVQYVSAELLSAPPKRKTPYVSHGLSQEDVAAMRLKD